MTAQGQGARIAALDGVRGLAVVAVVLFHADVGVARGGFLGVSAFFTLSGFLITSLLLAEHRATGRIALGAFWARRARRLLPAAAVALAGILVYGATVADASQVRDLRGDVLAALGYVANWRFWLDGRAYEELFSAPSPLLHFWSLAIEEQFYVLFPAAVVLGLRLGRGRAALLTGALGTATVASIAASNLFANDRARAYYGTDTRAAELLIGALLAVVCLHRPAPRTAAGRRVLGLAGVGALAVMAFWWATAEQSDAWLYHGGFALHAALTAVVIAASRTSTPVARALSVRPLVGLGRVSYGVYLYHWPLFLRLSPDRIRLAEPALLVVRVAVTLAAAIVSYHVVEQPVRLGRRLLGAWPRVLAPGAAAALVLALFAVTASPPPPGFVLSPVSDRAPVADDSPAAATGAARAPGIVAPGRPTAAPVQHASDYHRPLTEDRPLRALVVGDSVGTTFGRGMELWAAETGGAVVRNEARPWCSLGRELPRLQAVGPADVVATCSDWDERWPAVLDEFDPDVVFVMYTIWEVAPRLLPGAGDHTRPGDPAHDAWQLAEYQAAADVLSARGARVVWFTVPCHGVPIETGEPLWHLNERTIPELARTREAVRVIDLDAELCPGGVVKHEYAGIPDARPDNAHFSDAGAVAVARWVMRTVLPPGLAPTTLPVAATAPTRRHRALDRDRSARLMVVGDSVGLTLGRGLELWGASTGRAVVRNEARKFCSLGRYAPRIAGTERGTQGAACDDWAESWPRALAEFDPDVVVVLYTIWELAPRRLDDGGEFVGPADARYGAWQLGEYRAAADVLSARGARVVWLTVPCTETEPSSPGESAWHVNRTISRLSHAHRAVDVVDLDAELCPGHVPVQSYAGVDPARPDGRHFSDDAALAVATWLGAEVLGAEPSP